MRACLWGLLIAGCGFGDNSLALATADAPPASRDSGGDDDAAADAPRVVDRPHLLLTEVGALGSGEFVEIFNPTAAPIDLSTYYLTDTNDYWKLPGHVAGNLTLAIAPSDFLARFPAHASIAAGEVQTIAIEEDGFFLTYDFDADYALDSTAGAAFEMVPVVEAANPLPSITDSGEMIALFHWDGASDLVDDVDIVIAGSAPVASNAPIAKQPIDGPDGDGVATAYETDALTIGDMESDAVGTETYKRIALESGHEVRDGHGNGITGDDETSENIRLTWDSGAYTAATPGTVPDTLKR